MAGDWRRSIPGLNPSDERLYPYLDPILAMFATMDFAFLSSRRLSSRRLSSRRLSSRRLSSRRLSSRRLSSRRRQRRDGRRDSAIASPTSEPGSPVVNDWVPVDQIHRKKPHEPSMENEFASPPSKTQRHLRRDEQKEELSQKDRCQDTRSNSPSKKVRNADRDAKE
jgi:hypothetical protein